MSIYIHKDGQQRGPLSLEEVNSKVLAGEFTGSDSAWIDGWDDWKNLSSIPGFVPRPGPPPFKSPSSSPQRLRPAQSNDSFDSVMEPQLEIATVDAPPSEGANNNAVFFYMPMSRFIWMNVLTLGSYQSYWMYRNWRYLRERDNNTRIWPVWRAIFAVFGCLRLLLKDIKNDPVANCVVPAQFPALKLAIGWTTAWILAGIFNNNGGLIGLIILLIIPPLKLPHILALVGGGIGDVAIIWLILMALSILCIYAVQRYVNRVNESLSPRPAYSPWAIGETVFAVIGGIGWFCLLLQWAGAI
jgi:hypothetical protein